MLKHFLYLIFLLFALQGVAMRRPYKIDSLKTLLADIAIDKKHPIDSAAIKNLNKLAAEFVSSYPDSTLFYGEAAISGARNIGYKKGIADGLLATADVYYAKANYTKATENLNEAITIYERLNNLKGVSSCYKIYGDLYNQASQYQRSLAYYNKALAIKIKIDDQQGIAGVYLHMGNVNDNIGSSTMALDYYFKALAIDINIRDIAAEASAYNNIGYILQHMEIYPKALEYFFKALKTFQKLNKLGGIAAVTQNIGEVLIEQGDYAGAIKYLNISMKISKEQDSKDGIGSLYTDLGLCYAHTKQYEKAIQSVKAGLQVSVDSKIDYNITYALVGFATIYNMEGNYVKAYQYAIKSQTLADKLGNITNKTKAVYQLGKSLGGLKLYTEAYKAQARYNDLRDSLKSDENIQKFTSYTIESNFIARQKQQDLYQQEKDAIYQQRIQRQRLYSAIFLAIIAGMVCVLIVYYRAKIRQQKINEVLASSNHQVLRQKTDLDEQAKKLNELNQLKDRLISILAHDLRAPLSTLRGLFSLLQDETLSHQEVLEMIPQVLRRLEYTSDFLDTLLFWINSQMENFENSARVFTLKDIVTPETETNYEAAQSKGIKIEDRVPADLQTLADPNSIRIVVRNLITNAIKFSRKNDVITVSAMKEDENTVVVSVKDTGIGMPAAQLDMLFKSKVTSGTGTNNESGTGMGLLFCKDLVEKNNGIIRATSIPGAGTEFLFTLPLAVSKQITMEAV